MNRLAPILMLAILATPAIAQTAKPSEKKDPPKLSDAYAKAALLAAKSIESDTSEGEDGRDPRQIKATEAVDAADVEGDSIDEKNITKQLRHLIIEKEIDNIERHTQAILVMMKSKDRSKYADDIATDPVLIGIAGREAACFEDLDKELRARSIDFPKSCEEIMSKSETK